MSRRKSDLTLYILIEGKWEATDQEASSSEELPNFLIVCDYGDWSGFRTLDECLSQIPSGWRNHSTGFFSIVQR